MSLLYGTSSGMLKCPNNVFRHQVAAPAPATANAGSASQKEFEKLFEAYAAKNPANGQPNPNCRMKVIRCDFHNHGRCRLLLLQLSVRIELRGVLYMHMRKEEIRGANDIFVRCLADRLVCYFIVGRLALMIHSLSPPPTHNPLPASSQHVVYNQVDPSLRNSYARPEFMDDKMWKKVNSRPFEI